MPINRETPKSPVVRQWTVSTWWCFHSTEFLNNSFSFVLAHGHNTSWRMRHSYLRDFAFLNNPFSHPQVPRGIQPGRGYPGEDWQMDFTHGPKGLLEPVWEGLYTILAIPTEVKVP
ncbi:unnamed protein product [Nyctereutes procyonoides]|uniref:(raccoon dog) hypothetical protein n=1 Tax=Nyctereutes procyonoides TaxID=34880 RepID=A0A811Y8V8_NYCPR|nr:unnamed protein product [Nyctereutes procyonoides]